MTFFEPADSMHRYVVAGIPETAGVRRRTEPRENATELLGNPLVLGVSVDVACTTKVGRYEWAELRSDTSWVPLAAQPAAREAQRPSLNDRQGHQAGDDVLRAVADTIVTQSRISDAV